MRLIIIATLVLTAGVCLAQTTGYAPVRAELEGGTTVYSVTTPVFETTADATYQTERYGPDFTYIFHGLPPGPARLKLGFCENRYDRRGQRVFDVALQDKRVLERFDVVREAGGANRSIVRVFQGVPVAGQLRIRLDPSAAREPVLCGLELIEETP